MCRLIAADLAVYVLLQRGRRSMAAVIHKRVASPRIGSDGFNGAAARWRR